MVAAPGKVSWICDLRTNKNKCAYPLLLYDHAWLWQIHKYKHIKESLTREFQLQFFSWISVHWAPEYLLGIVRLFSKIRGDNRDGMFISGVNDTRDKLSPVPTTLLSNLSPLSTTLAINLCHGFSVISSAVDTGDKFITSVVITDDNCSPVSLIPGKMLSPVSLSPADHCSPLSVILAINLSPALLSPAIIVQRCQRHRW